MIPSELNFHFLLNGGIFTSLNFCNLKFVVVTTFYRYGLGAAVLSKDLDRCERLTKVKILFDLIHF